VREVSYLSAPAPVSNADCYFQIADVDHFWVHRRFEVFRRLAGSLIGDAREIAEVGCGHGLIQRQVEQVYNREVAGFDLSEFALRRNLSRRSTVFCYDICEKSPQFKARFDLIFLFDVLEHIDDEDCFLRAILFHLAPRGSLVVNVPAGQWLFSAYDRAAGHKRRYSIGSLRKAADRSEFQVAHWCYWGLPLLPVLMLRKVLLAGKRDREEIYSAGFDSRSRFINALLGLLSQCEPANQRFLGASLMAVLRAGHLSG
jgi:SAM-dependent methyltransferase